MATPDELDHAGLEVIVRVDESERARDAFDEFDWRAARDLAADGTRLYPGDLLVGPALAAVDGIGAGSFVELEMPGIGVLEQVVSR